MRLQIGSLYCRFRCWSAYVDGKCRHRTANGNSSELKLFNSLGSLVATFLEVAAVDLDLLEIDCLSFESLLGRGPVHQCLVKLFQRVDFKLRH